MTALTIAFTSGLSYEFRELFLVFAEHLKDNGGKVLPHLLIADYARFLTADDEVSNWKVKFLQCLEEAFAEGGEIDELISVSFIENLPYAKGQRHWSIDYLGPRMRKQYFAIFRA